MHRVRNARIALHDSGGRIARDVRYATTKIRSGLEGRKRDAGSGSRLTVHTMIPDGFPSKKIFTPTCADLRSVPRVNWAQAWVSTPILVSTTRTAEGEDIWRRISE